MIDINNFGNLEEIKIAILSTKILFELIKTCPIKENESSENN